MSIKKIRPYDYLLQYRESKDFYEIHFVNINNDQ